MSGPNSPVESKAIIMSKNGKTDYDQDIIHL